MSAKLILVLGAVAFLAYYAEATGGSKLTVGAEKAADTDAQTALDRAFQSTPQMSGWMGSSLSQSKRTVLRYATVNRNDGSKIYFLKTRIDPPKTFRADNGNKGPFWAIYRVTKSSSGKYTGDGAQSDGITVSTKISYFDA